MIKEADSDIAEALVSAFRKRGIKVICGTKLKRVERTRNGKSVWYERNGEEKVAEADEIFYALGRKPAVQGLGLEKAGVETTNRMRWWSTTSMQTSQPHIFAGRGRHWALRNCAHRDPAGGDCGPECEAVYWRAKIRRPSIIV